MTQRELLLKPFRRVRLCGIEWILEFVPDQGMLMDLITYCKSQSASRAWRKIVQLGSFFAVATIVTPTHARQFQAGPWFVDVEPSSAISVLFSSDQAWTLMIRCLARQTDIIVRRLDEPETTQTSIRHFNGVLGVDGLAMRLPVQTFSQGGFLMLEAAVGLDLIETGRSIRFKFEDLGAVTLIDFVSSQAKQALAPVRQLCRGATS